jgi:hypothetical protein
MPSPGWRVLKFRQWVALIASLAILLSLLTPVLQALQAEEKNNNMGIPPAIPACYGPSGFPEVAKLYLWESNPNNCNTDCECNERTGHFLDPVGNKWLLMIPESPTAYGIAYSDQTAEPATGRITCLWHFKRLPNGSIEISANPAFSSYSFYSIYDGPPSKGGKPLPNLYRVKDVKNYDCVQTISAHAVTVIPGEPCK